MFRTSTDLSTFDTSGNTLPVRIKAILHESFITGEIKNVTSLWEFQQCKTDVINSKNATTVTADASVIYGVENHCFYENSNLLTNGSIYYASDYICRGLVKGVDYTIYHNADSIGSIYEVAATVTITDIPYLIQTGCASSVQCKTKWQEEFSATFQSVNQGSQRSSLGNKIMR